MATMKITSIAYNGSSFFGNLCFDFVNPNIGDVYGNVIIVGENGCCKTYMLKDIENFLRFPGDINEDIAEIKFSVGENKYCIKPHVYSGTVGWRVEDLQTHDVYDQDYHDEGINDHINLGEGLKVISLDSINDFSPDAKAVDFDKIDESLNKIQSDDCINYAYYNIEHDDNPKKWSEFFEGSKVARFANALNGFFDDLKYFGLGFDNKSHQAIGFVKNGNKCNVRSLSSGEKQIIMRTVSILLEDKDQPSGESQSVALFIDEPEMSLHPKWQSRILNHYKSLFVKGGTSRITQLFATSHSSEILKTALDDNDTLIIRLYRRADGSLSYENIKNGHYLTDITYAEVNYIVFGIATPEYHNQLYGQIQINNNLGRIKQADDYIKNHHCYNPHLHYKHSSNGTTTYDTLCSYIRNAIDHPDNGNLFSDEELVTSIQLMQEILR